MKILEALLLHFCITGFFLTAASWCLEIPLAPRQILGVWLLLLMFRFTNPNMGGSHK